MKKALKVIIPITIILVLLIAAYLFFFQYRSDISAGMLTQWGDKRMEADNYSGALKYYQRAYDLNPEDTELAKKLAEAYRLTGNYTKAEYYLVHAIYTAPEDIDLYLALSSIYVEQDKLLDAQLMLDRVSNETVRQQLDAMRPAAPVISPEGGKYSDYVSVSASCGEDAVCYLTLNGEYPSLNKDAYSEPITLEAGESTVCAIAVGNNGLTSTAVYAGYTITGVIEDAVFEDKTLESYVQELLSKTGRQLRTNDLWDMTELELPEGVTTLSDLRYFTELESLTVRDFTGDDYSFLTVMPSLRQLDLSGCSLSAEGLETIGGCSRLEELNLCDCGISNIDSLSGLSSLKILKLDDNSINDLTAVSSMTALEELYICRNAVTSLSPLSKLTGLRILDVSLNSLENISPIGTCTTLSELNVSENKLTSVSVVGKLVNLTVLKASKNEIDSVEGIENCTKLQVFEMSNNLLVDISGLKNIATLTDINIDYNDVLEVPAFVEGCTLVNFSAAHNFLEDCEGLRGLQNLNYVNMDYNNIRDISCLLDCPVIVQINVFGTYIKDADEFRENGIIVNYDPT